MPRTAGPSPSPGSLCTPSHRRRASPRLHALPVEHVVHAAEQLSQLDHQELLADGHSALSAAAQHLSLAYERVTLPCSSMNCGDAIYRRCASPGYLGRTILTSTRCKPIMEFKPKPPSPQLRTAP